MALDGKKLASPSPKKTVFSYRTKSSHSNVDETLFGTPTRFLQQVETRRQSHDADWDPPWFTGPNSSGRPLLWTPFSSMSWFGRLINFFFCKFIVLKLYL